MRRVSSVTVPIALSFLLLAVSCSRAPRHKDLYWHGEMWDGMNRMVFSLQDTGWRIENVDTQAGVIVAWRRLGNSRRKGPGDKAEEQEAANGARGGAGGDPSAASGSARTSGESPAGGGAGEARGRAADVRKIRIRFPASSDLPIIISPGGPEGDTTDMPKFERMVRGLTKRFIWYGGPSLEVRERE